MFISRHAIFLEKEFILQKGSGRNIELEEVQQLDISQPNHDIVSIEPEHTTPIRRSDRVHHAPERYGFIIENNEVQIIENDEPLTYTNAVKSRLREMATSHEIQNGLYVYQPSVDFG